MSSGIVHFTLIMTSVLMPDLKTIRELLGLSQQELADKLNVSARTIARWEAGGVMHWIYTHRLDALVAVHQTHVEQEPHEEANRPT